MHGPQSLIEFMGLCFSAAMFPCHIDALDQPEGTLFPLRCERIAYLGLPGGNGMTHRHPGPRNRTRTIRGFLPCHL